MPIKNRPTLILGGQGQLGTELKRVLSPFHPTVLDKSELNLTDLEQLKSYLEQTQPQMIYNAAAYTLVDQAETDKETNFTINALVPEVLAQYCQQWNATLVHYSTDYVYTGDGHSPWQESDDTGPLNEYGRAKLAGEQKIQTTCDRHYIFRTSWVYNSTHKNFLTTMIHLAKERPELKVVSDQVGVPTYAPDLARWSVQAVQSEIRPTPYGIYNLCPHGETTWYDFANTIFSHFQELGVPLMIHEVHPIASEDYPTPATRPKNSRLNTNKFEQTFGISLTSWQDGVEDCVKTFLNS